MVHKGYRQQFAVKLLTFNVVLKSGGSSLADFGSPCIEQTFKKINVRMLTQKVLCHSVHPSDWFVTIDLTDVYFHVFIYPVHRKFLRFAYQGVTYKFQGIPFGLPLAPRVLSKCVEAALFPLGNSGVRIFSHIKDCLYVFAHESR